MHRSCFGRSELLCRQLYFKLNPSLKFLSSFNSPRNFFSPSRGEIKMFLLIKSKIFFIFLNNSNRKRLCLFASWHLCVFTSKSRLAASLPSCLAAKNTHLSKRKSVGALPPPRRLFLNHFSFLTPSFSYLHHNYNKKTSLFQARSFLYEIYSFPYIIIFL